MPEAEVTWNTSHNPLVFLCVWLPKTEEVEKKKQQKKTRTLRKQELSANIYNTASENTTDTTAMFLSTARTTLIILQPRAH